MLQDLSLDGTRVSDLSPLAGLTALQRVTLNDTPVTDLSPLAGITALHTLWFEGKMFSGLPLVSLLGRGKKTHRLRKS
jgi:Leucine-rich repeat (LRR) protein